jgi:hypothetical protein
MLDGREEGVLQRFLGQFQIAQPADEGGEELAILLPVNTFEDVTRGVGQKLNVSGS